MDILNLFNKYSENQKGIALLPVKGFVECPFEVEGVNFVHASDIVGLDLLLQQIDERSFLPIESISDDFYKSDLSGDSLRRYSSSLSGISKEVLSKSTLAVLEVSIDWNEFKSYTHQQDIALLLSLSEVAFESLDIVRFQFCQLGLPDTLPGIPGFWDRSNGFLGCAVLGPSGGGRVLGGKRTGVGMVEGLGLELDAGQIRGILTGECANIIDGENHGGEIGSAARRAMHMLSRAMYANSDTLKFLSVMALFEYLGAGTKYKKFEEVRKKLQPHIARNVEEYNRLSERFQELSSKGNSNSNSGYRHRIVHEGALLEEILPSDIDRKSLFSELGRYAGKVIYDMCQNHSFTWRELQEWRAQKTSQLHVK